MMTQALGFARVESGRMLAVLAEVAIGIWVLFLFLLAVAWAPVDRRFGSQGRRDLEFFPAADVPVSGVETDDLRNTESAPAGAGARNQADD